MRGTSMEANVSRCVERLSSAKVRVRKKPIQVPAKMVLDSWKSDSTEYLFFEGNNW